MTNMVGQQLGKYELLDRLARGGMAEIYKALQPGIERTVVIKVLHGHLVETDNFVARFQREARAIGRLQHPHIVRIIDVGVERDVYYTVMDYVQGGTLGDYLKDRKRVPPDEALRFVAQLTDALCYAHREGIVHRDIKPANILFVDESYSQVVLTDFGLARLRDDSASSLTITGALVGTPTYMSPEAVQGEQCDGRADIYSLGVVLYEMVTGKPPYTANTPYSMMIKQTNEPLPSPRALNPALPVVVEELLMKALAKDPNDRYQNAEEFARAIQQTLTILCQEQVSNTAPAPAPQGQGDE